MWGAGWRAAHTLHSTFKEFLLDHVPSTSFSVVAQREPFDPSTKNMRSTLPLMNLSTIVPEGCLW